MPWEMSWFPSPAAFAACSVFVWLLLVLFVYRLAVTVGKPQVGASAGAEPSPGRQGGGSAGAREQPQGRAGEALPGRGGRFPGGPWPGSGFLLVLLRRQGMLPSHPLLSLPV